MARLIWKHSHVTGRRGLHPEFQIFPLHHPSRRDRLAEFPLAPLASTFFHELAVCRPPSRRELSRPLRLPRRTHKHIFTESFELLACAPVHPAIVRPLSRQRLHTRCPRSNIYVCFG